MYNSSGGISMRHRIRTAALALLTIFIITVPAAAEEVPLARNVIILIGDGMGFEQVEAGSYYLSGAPGNISFEPYHKSAARTRSANSLVTDSAAAATALATGHKVNDGVLSQMPDGSPIKTILEIAKDLGKSTGLVTSVPINHATPAGFGAHESSRNSYYAIGYDYLNGSRPNVLFGAGDPAKSSSYLSTAHVTQAQSLGYQVIHTADALAALPDDTPYVFGLFGGGNIAYEYQRSTSTTDPHLSQMAAKALQLLETDSDGFFLMIEGGLIDWACHDNNLRRTVHEVVEFANTFDVVKAWADDNPGTLVIVTADHETGGLNTTGGEAGQYPTAHYTTGSHTGANVPVYALGPGSELFDNYIQNGEIENTHIFQVMKDAILVPPEETVGIGSLKGLPDGSGVTIANKIVTVGTDVFYNTAYIQDTGRAGGIKLVTTLPLSAGSRVDILGGTITTQNGERIISNPDLLIHNGPYDIPAPVLLRARDLGGGALNEYTHGVNNGFGLHNTGLLVRLAGRVTAVNPGSKLFAIEDGSGTTNLLGTTGALAWCAGLVGGQSLAMPEVGQFVEVTGISSRLWWGYPLAVIRPRTLEDIRVLDETQAARPRRLIVVPVRGDFRSPAFVPVRGDFQPSSLRPRSW